MIHVLKLYRQNMPLTPIQYARAIGVLLGTAAGDGELTETFDQR